MARVRRAPARVRHRGGDVVVERDGVVTRRARADAVARDASLPREPEERAERHPQTLRPRVQDRGLDPRPRGRVNERRSGGGGGVERFQRGETRFFDDVAAPVLMTRDAPDLRQRPRREPVEHVRTLSACVPERLARARRRRRRRRRRRQPVHDERSDVVVVLVVHPGFLRREADLRDADDGVVIVVVVVVVVVVASVPIPVAVPVAVPVPVPVPIPARADGKAHERVASLRGGRVRRRERRPRAHDQRLDFEDEEDVRAGEGIRVDAGAAPPHPRGRGGRHAKCSETHTG